MGKAGRKEDVTVESNGHKFVLRQYNHKAQREIRDASIEISDGKKRLLMGTFADEVIFHSLSSWDLTDEKGNLLPVTRENFDEYFPNECTDDVYEAAGKLNSLPEDEKNA